MPGISLEQAQANLDAANTAYQKALKVKSYAVGSSRQKTNHDIDKLRGEVEYWNNQVIQLSSGSRGRRIRGGTPV